MPAALPAVADANALIGGIPTLTYFVLPGGTGGRGGALALFLAAAGVVVERENVAFADWPALKAKLVETGENPAAHLPLLRLGDDLLTDSHAIARFLGRKLGLYGTSAERDYKADVIDAAVVEARAAWVKAFTGDAAAKEDYLSKTRATHYACLEALLAKAGAAGATTVAGGAAIYVDALVYAVLHDDGLVFGTELLGSGAYPRLKAFQDAFGLAPAVAAWAQALADAFAATTASS